MERILRGIRFKAEVARWLVSMCLLTMAAGSVAARVHRQAQDPGGSSAQDPGTKPPDAPPAPEKKPDTKQKGDTGTQNAPDQPTWDPLRAEKDLEVGRYYMHKGDVDAAMERFQDAITAKPGYALPYRMLAEAQEKKGMKKAAIKSYTKYLDLYPQAEDADKVHKKIEKLYADVEKEKKNG
jgi:tetratricopeptide (TPR) repeat protein